jgi:ribokinase
MTMSAPQIVVVGSINMDLVARMSRLPRPGETLHGDDFQTIPGGKGANQAVAAARLGAQVTMIGRVGDDAFGGELLRSLELYGVGTQYVQKTANYPSGVAVINVEASGANAIVVIAGANGRLTADDVANCASVIASADVVVVQLETPVETVITAIRTARKFKVRTILDPAPAPSSPLPAELQSVDYISPNQSEAEALTGIVVDDLTSAERAAKVLCDRGARHVVMKLGELGALIYSDGKGEHIAAVSTEIVDTTAAGDAFTAGLAVGLAEGRTLAEATKLGCAAGTLACTVFGAQPAMPTREKVDRFLGVER